MNQAMVTTAFEFSGYRVQRHLGVVRGLTVRSRSAIGNIAGSIQSLFGGNISIYTELCEHARQEAFDLMVAHADALGANAIIGMRYDANDVMEGITEVLAYGTAVVIAPLGHPSGDPLPSPASDEAPLPGDPSPVEPTMFGSPVPPAPQQGGYGSGQWGNAVAFELTAAQTPLYQQSNLSAPVLTELPAGAVVVVAAEAGDFLQVVTQDDDFGFIQRGAAMTPVQP